MSKCTVNLLKRTWSLYGRSNRYSWIFYRSNLILDIWTEFVKFAFIPWCLEVSSLWALRFISISYSCQICSMGSSFWIGLWGMLSSIFCCIVDTFSGRFWPGRCKLRMWIYLQYQDFQGWRPPAPNSNGPFKVYNSAIQTISCPSCAYNISSLYNFQLSDSETSNVPQYQTHHSQRPTWPPRIIGDGW